MMVRDRLISQPGKAQETVLGFRLAGYRASRGVASECLPAAQRTLFAPCCVDEVTARHWTAPAFPLDWAAIGLNPVLLRFKSDPGSFLRQGSSTSAARCGGYGGEIRRGQANCWLGWNQQIRPKISAAVGISDSGWFM